jgi:ribonuclease HII
MQKKNEESQLILGIDDAGRGPLIGPMALAGCLINKGLEEEFRDLGVKDSKMLTSKKREFLAEEIRKKAISHYVTLSFPEKIDDGIKNGTNLNKIEAMEAAEIINKITENLNEPVSIIIDCPSTNREAWRNQVLSYIHFPENLKIVCEHKADRDYIAVGAASILAKSQREREVAKIKEKIGKDFGSGYTSDPKTIDFMKKYSKEHKNDGIFRKSWATFRNNNKDKQQKKLFDY